MCERHLLETVAVDGTMVLGSDFVVAFSTMAMGSSVVSIVLVLSSCVMVLDNIDYTMDVVAKLFGLVNSCFM